MGLLQKACETYDRFARQAGVEEENMAVLAPVSHTVTAAQIQITLDQDGNFKTARLVSKDEPKILIPVTAESAGRTSAACAHPLCDQLAYLAEYHEEKHRLYVNQLTDWAHSEFSHPMLQPILTYVKSGSILADLVSCQIIELNEHGIPQNEKALVRWVVDGLDKEGGPCWTNRALMQAFIAFYHDRHAKSKLALCMITGEWESPAEQHPKGIIPVNGNAKLISANDSVGFTYRGRFSSSWQAATVGYTASQKAHNALRWLVANQGIRTPGQTSERIDCGGRTFLCWNPQGYVVPNSLGPLRRRRETSPPVVKLTDYRKQLQETLAGWRTDLPDKADVVIAAFDAATTGRLSITYYNELRAIDFLERLRNWDETCSWNNWRSGIQSPTLYRIVQYAFGTQRGGKMEPPAAKLLRQHVQRLVACRIDGRAFPRDITRNLVDRASHLHIYDKETRETLLFITCSAIRKEALDRKKEEWNMALNPESTDRSYLFGRLLAIAEKVEKDTYTQDTERETNAMRLQAAFAQRPLSTWRVLKERLRPYYRRLKPGTRTFYEKITQEIIEKLSETEPELNHRLGDIYLIGYYHQRSALYTGKKDAGDPTDQIIEKSEP